MTTWHITHDRLLDDELYHKSKIIRSVIALGQIDTGRRVIHRTHRLTEYLLVNTLVASPFVPPGHEGIFARGILAGFGGDLITACHLLVPQIESSIRYLMEQHDLSTTVFGPDGVQGEMDLNVLLRKPAVMELLGDDLVFDLRGLLIERLGYNFRNRLAHGLLGDADFSTAEALYAWWIVLKMCIYPFAVAELKNEP